MTNFKIYISQVKSLMKHLIVSIYFMYFYSVGFGGSVVSSYFVKCRLCLCVMVYIQIAFMNLLTFKFSKSILVY